MRIIQVFLFIILTFALQINHIYAEEKSFATPDKNIKLFAEKNDKDNVYDNFTLMINKKKYQFPEWINVVNRVFEPKVVFEDITGDNKKEIIVILTEGYGSGFMETKAHVFQEQKNGVYKELFFEDPFLIAKENVVSHLTTEEVLLDIKGKKYNVNIKRLNIKQDQIFSEASFESRVEYDVSEGKLKAILGVQITPASFIGDLVIEYKYEKEYGLKPVNIIFKK